MPIKKILSLVLILVMMVGLNIVNFNAETTKDYAAYAAKLDETAYNGNDLGATYTKKATTFKVWSPTASEVKVRLYKYGSEKENKDGFFKEQDMTFDKSNGWVAKSLYTKDDEEKYLDPSKYFLYSPTTDVDRHQYWPIFQVNIDAARGALWNDYDY